jgi:hypothetical protein
MELETINKLYLELSQVATAKTAKERSLEAKLQQVLDSTDLNVKLTDQVLVMREDANNYCRILRILGMEEEGDPVAEVKRLKEVGA